MPTESQSASNACREEETRLIRDMQGGLAIQAAIEELQARISDPQPIKLRGYIYLSLACLHVLLQACLCAE